jgi:hypothetical protein
MQSKHIAYIPGHQLDRLIASRVFGWTVAKEEEGSLTPYLLVEEDGEAATLGVFEARFAPSEEEAWRNCPPFSVDWDFAGHAIEHMDGLGWSLELIREENGWRAILRGAGEQVATGFGSHGPHAICLAALAAAEKAAISHYSLLDSCREEAASR